MFLHQLKSKASLLTPLVTRKPTNKSTHMPQETLQSSTTPPTNLRKQRLSAPPPPNMSRSASNQPELNTPIIEPLQPYDVGHSTTQESDMNISGSKVCKKRGITRGIELAKRKRAGETIEVNIPVLAKRAVGPNSQCYITQGGCVVRRYAPLQVDGWSDISEEEVAALIRCVCEQFSLTTESHVDEVIVDDMKRRYYSWRYALHQIYLSYGTVEDTLENRLVVAEDD